MKKIVVVLSLLGVAGGPLAFNVGAAKLQQPAVWCHPTKGFCLVD